METTTYIARRDGYYTMGVLWHILVITALCTLVCSLQSISAAVSVNSGDLIPLMECWPWRVVLLSQLLVPVPPPPPGPPSHNAAFQGTGDLPRLHGSLLGSFLLSVY